jgi:hypothetical protein
MGEVLGSSPGHTKDFKNGTYCSSPQPVLVIMSLIKGNVLAIKKVQLIPYTIDLKTKVVQLNELVV